MPRIHFRGVTLQVPQGTNLRCALREAGLSPHNGNATWFNCKGFGSCGTCAVQIQGKVHELTAMERWRLQFPPHNLEAGLRLACQIRVEHDLMLEKWEGFWGQNPSNP